MRLDPNNADAPQAGRLAQVIAQCEEPTRRAKSADCTLDERGRR